MSVYDRKSSRNKITRVRTNTHELTTWLCDNCSSWIICHHCRDNYLSFDSTTGKLNCDTSCKFTIGVKAFYKKQSNNVLEMVEEMTGNTFSSRSMITVGS